MTNSRSNVAPPGAPRSIARNKGNRLTALAASVSFVPKRLLQLAQVKLQPPRTAQPAQRPAIVPLRVKFGTQRRIPPRGGEEQQGVLDRHARKRAAS